MKTLLSMVPSSLHLRVSEAILPPQLASPLQSVTPMKVVDYIIVAAVVSCMFVGYSGHRIEASLLLFLVVILASWRFWNRSREKHIDRCGCSGELNPELDDPVVADSWDDSAA
jgi:hypothetical protein